MMGSSSLVTRDTICFLRMNRSGKRSFASAPAAAGILKLTYSRAHRRK